MVLLNRIVAAIRLALSPEANARRAWLELVEDADGCARGFYVRATSLEWESAAAEAARQFGPGPSPPAELPPNKLDAESAALGGY
jgi:hypothetical protein